MWIRGSKPICPRPALTMGIIILEAGYPIRKSKCWSLFGLRDGEAFLDAMEAIACGGAVFSADYLGAGRV